MRDKNTFRVLRILLVNLPIFNVLDEYELLLYSGVHSIALMCARCCAVCPRSILVRGLWGIFSDHMSDLFPNPTFPNLAVRL